jgi:site-specific DNA-methyltransferase (adenine-specific)
MLYYNSNDLELYKGDCIDILKDIPDNSIDLIFADPPYFLSNGGISCKAGKIVSVNKADWDKSNGIDKDYEFTFDWLSECKRVLKGTGSIWISGTMHNIYQVGYALQKLDYKILNEISWFKPNAPPNLSCRYFAHSHETLIWARKDQESKHKFNYELMKKWDDKISESGKQMRSVWNIPLTPQQEKKSGKHPTQKPLELLKRVILSSTDKGDLILDPFNGSGTTGVVSKLYNRRYIGIDLDKKYLDLTLKRVNALETKINESVYTNKNVFVNKSATPV